MIGFFIVQGVKSRFLLEMLRVYFRSFIYYPESKESRCNVVNMQLV